MLCFTNIGPYGKGILPATIVDPLRAKAIKSH
jgi:hypothetical protein